MARRDLPLLRSGRLRAVLGPAPRPGTARAGPAPAEPPTEPLPAVGPGPRVRRVRRLMGRLLPESWRGARADPGRPGAIALALVAAAAAVLAAVGVWTDRPRVEPLPALPAITVNEGPAPAAGSASASAEPVPPLVVSVSGRVARPGLVQVPDGSRVADVVAAAGGALPGTDLTTVNLARRVADGEQVAVGVPAAPDAAPAATGGSGSVGPGDGRPAGKIDLNVATVEQLDTLPGVGPVTAERILAWRTSHGRFARVDQLREIEGIGERRFGQLRELVTV